MRSDGALQRRTDPQGPRRRTGDAVQRGRCTQHLSPARARCVWHRRPESSAPSDFVLSRPAGLAYLHHNQIIHRDIKPDSASLPSWQCGPALTRSARPQTPSSPTPTARTSSSSILVYPSSPRVRPAGSRRTALQAARRTWRPSCSRRTAVRARQRRNGRRRLGRRKRRTRSGTRATCGASVRSFFARFPARPG